MTQFTNFYFHSSLKQDVNNMQWKYIVCPLESFAGLGCRLGPISADSGKWCGTLWTIHQPISR